MSVSNSTAEKPHKKARPSPYPGSQVERSQVSNVKLSWLVQWPEYKLVKYTSGSVLAGPRWADPLWGETSLPNLTKRMGLLREGARTVGMRLNMVDLEILQLGQAWLVEGFGGAGAPIMLQIPS